MKNERPILNLLQQHGIPHFKMDEATIKCYDERIGDFEINVRDQDVLFSIKDEMYYALQDLQKLDALLDKIISRKK